MKVCGYQFTVISFAVAAVLCRAELTVNLKPEVESRFVYEPFTLLLDINAKADPPDIPPSGGFSVAGITAVSTGETNSSFRIEIVPEQSGMLTILPFTVKSGEETVQTPLLRLPVSAPRRAGEMSLSLSFSATRLYVDQPVRMDVTWTSKVPFVRCEELLLDLPVLHDPNWETYPMDPGVPEKDRIGLPVNGQRVIAKKTASGTDEQLTFSFMLVPKKSGVYRPAEARLNCALLSNRKASSQYPSYFDNHFFSLPEKNDRYERIYLSAPEPELTVQSLPEAGRTARYSGIVGGCTAQASIRPVQTVVGQPVLLTVELTGLPFGPSVKTLPDATLDGIGSEFQITKRPLHDSAGETSRTFTYVLRPLRSGITAVPALALQVFIPEQKTYETVRTQPLRIQVDPDRKQTVYVPYLNEENQPRAPHTGIRGNRNESRLTMNTYQLFEIIAHAAWAFWLLPPLLWLALRPWLRRRDRCRIDPAYVRALQAARRFRRTVKNDEQAAWKNYLADRFNLNAEALTYETVAREFEKRKIDIQLLQAVRDCFQQQDSAKYSPQKAKKPCTSVQELVRRIEKTVPFLLLALCLLNPFSTRAATPEQLFDQAMQIRTEKPDEAQPLFTEAALGFEADEQFLNAGNSWFFAGKNGRALANYLSAERLQPFNKQIRESIAFIRTQRADVFQSSEKPVSKVSKVWKQFGRWSPMIRFGLLTLIYLTGWIAFLTARFCGKRVPKRGWILLGLIALIPAASLFWSFFQPLEGVVIESAEARLGPGYAYDKAYEIPLHDATEFQWLEKRDGWVHARLPDKSEAWLRESAAVKVR